MGSLSKPPRSSEEFTAIAVDIWGQLTPDLELENRENWESLADIKANAEDFLGEGDDVKVFFMTKAKT